LEWTRQVPDFLIQPGSNWEAYKKGLSRNTKESLRKCYASLRRDNLHHELSVAESTDDVMERLQTFLELHSLRAHAAITPEHSNVFATGRSRSFLREFLARDSEAASIKLFELLVDGEVVASRIGFALNDSLYLYFSGYHPRMSRYSVMTTCTVEAIKWAIQKRFKTINLSMGRDQSKLRWRPTEVPLIEARWISPSWRGPALHGISRAIKAVASPGELGSLVRMLRRQ
jgi:CelD/BcsL family acetyltransferase involved in cellulose biosynthesis